MPADPGDRQGRRDREGPHAAVHAATFQDLGRAASVHDFVVRAISGHATTTMQEHYSSVSGNEVRTGLAKVLALAGIAKAPANETRKAS